MHAAIVTSWGAAPKHTTVPDLPAPAPTQIRLRVLAAGIHRLVQ
ncbi:quinone oxidoreductase, partial [Colletotrichum musicola]